MLLTRPFTHHLCKGSPPQNQLLSCHGQQTQLPAHCWAEGTSPRGAHGLVLFSPKRLKLETFLQDGRAGQEVHIHKIFLLYHQEQTICSLHIVHGLTLSTMCIFIHLDPSGSSRWLGNACLSLPLSKLHCIMAPGKRNGHYACCDSSLLLLHPAPFLLKAGQCYLYKSPSQLGSHTPALAAPSVFSLLNSPEKACAFPNQDPEFCISSRRGQSAKGCIPNTPQGRLQRISEDTIPP